MSDPTPDQVRKKLQMIASCVYLATEESVADDISTWVRHALSHIEQRDAEVEQMRLRAHRMMRVFEPSMDGYYGAVATYEAAFGTKPVIDDALAVVEANLLQMTEERSIHEQMALEYAGRLEAEVAQHVKVRTELNQLKVVFHEDAIRAGEVINALKVQVDRLTEAHGQLLEISSRLRKDSEEWADEFDAILLAPPSKEKLENR